MSALNPDEEMKKIYRKSVRLLDSTQAELKQTRQVLRKTVTRLTLAAQSDNKEVNEALDYVKQSVNADLDIEKLEENLDEFFVLMNQSGNPNSEKSRKTISGLAKDYVLNYEPSEAARPYLSRLQGFIKNDLADDELTDQWLNIVNELAIELNLSKEVNSEYIAKVADFSKRLMSPVDVDYEPPVEDGIMNLLDGLARDLTPYVNMMSDSGSSDTSTQHDVIRALMSDLINHLVLSDNMLSKVDAVKSNLCYPEDESHSWDNVISDIVNLVNDNTQMLEQEKIELQSFVNKVTKQLSSIEEFVRNNRKDRDEIVSNATDLKDSVDTSVNEIQKEVRDATDIDQLKDSVNVHLSNIINDMEEHKRAEETKEKISRQSYARMIEEITTSQSTIQDLQEQLKDSRERLLRDTLTGLPNRLAFNERVSVEIHRTIRSGSPLCLSIWDIDHFKSINDTFGHNIGDKALQCLSKVILNRIRKVDMFARIGGEEFVLLMPDTSLENASNLNNQLRTTLEQASFYCDGEKCPITASVGISVFEINDTAETILKKADDALYQSKRNGRNQCTVYKNNLPD